MNAFSNPSSESALPSLVQKVPSGTPRSVKKGVRFSSVQENTFRKQPLAADMDIMKIGNWLLCSRCQHEIFLHDGIEGVKGRVCGRCGCVRVVKKKEPLRLFEMEAA